jgi:multicomponent Na+:H+ antiporter subunit D
MNEWWHPAWPLLAGVLAVPLLSGWRRTLASLALPLVALLIVWQLPEGRWQAAGFLDYELTLLVVDKLSRLFGLVFAFMAFAGMLYCCRQARAVELAAGFLYAGAALGVVFAGDLITLFVFWELMAVGSTLVIWSAGTEAAYRSSMRYLQIHLLGGVLLMAGIADHVAATGATEFAALPLDGASGWLILAGFLLNAGAPPLSAWVADAYPEASFGGTVFLSAFTTKAAVYALLRGFPGAEILIVLGMIMIFYGIIYALLENDMRRILAYSIVNQVGFMVCGVGLGTELAMNGAAAHAFTHIIYKALLLMSAGAVLYMTGRRKCSELGGLFQSMPLTAVCGIIGALSISAFPLTSGFVSKSMINDASAEQHLLLIWLLLQAASAGVFLHAGIKFPWFVFFQRDSGLRPADPPLNLRLAMLFMSALCILIGMAPCMLYRLLPYAGACGYEPYTAAHVLSQLQLLLFSGLAFFLMLPLMRRTETISLDIDWFYRRLGPWLAGALLAMCAGLGQALASAGQVSMARFRPLLNRIAILDRRLARGGAIGETVMLVVLLLAACLFVYLM